MGMRTVTYYGTPGLNYILIPEAAFREIALVTRVDLQYDPVTGTPGNRQYSTNGMGTIDFANDFTGPTFGRISRYELERVMVTYKE